MRSSGRMMTFSASHCRRVSRADRRGQDKPSASHSGSTSGELA
jgi:hypothetical protein